MISPTDLLQPSPAPHFKTFQVFLIYLLKCPSVITTKCSSLLVYSLNSSPIRWQKRILLVESCFCHGNPGFTFPCTSCIICCHGTQIIEIFHSLQLFLIYHNLHCLEILIILAFSTSISTPQYLLISASFNHAP